MPRTMIGQDPRVDRGRIEMNFSPGREYQRCMQLIIQSWMRCRQRRLYRDDSLYTNAQLKPRQVKRYCGLDQAA
jgi:hypothetical protein